MKKKLIKFVLISFCLGIIVTIYNTLEVHFFRKSIVENYKDESYMAPNFVSEFEKLKLKKIKEKKADAMQMNSTEKMIRDSSQWTVGQVDLSIIREDWHYNLYDLLKKENPAKAGKLLKDYFLIKTKEIKLVHKLENNFLQMNEQFLSKNNQIKDKKYYKFFHAKYSAKEELIEQALDVMEVRKKKLLGEDLFEKIHELSIDYNVLAKKRMLSEFDLTPEEIDKMERDFSHSKLLLAP